MDQQPPRSPEEPTEAPYLPPTPVLQTAEVEDFYASTGKKVTDFLLGFFGGIVTLVLAGILSGALPILAMLFLSLVLLGQIFAIVTAFTRRRRFIGIGILTYFVLIVVVIPLILFGACLLSGL